MPDPHGRRTALSRISRGSDGFTLGLLAPAGASDPAESRQITARSDSAGIEIVRTRPPARPGYSRKRFAVGT